jgi:tetratricopeptide (TPR) repeat protein
LQGHPLAIKIAAKLCTTYSPDRLVEDLSIFKKLREAIVGVLLDRVVLTSGQKALLEFASVFRRGITLELFRKWGGDAALFELESILARFLLELSGEEYWMHPAVANYFYEQADPRKIRSYHLIAADYYQREFGRARPRDIGLLVEAIHHVAASGDIERAKSLGVHKEQLRTLAKAAYARKDREGSLVYYEAISQIDSKDFDALAHLALILGRFARWGEADSNFDRARKLKESCWIHQAYGSVKVNGGLEHEGEKLLLRALELDPRDSAALAGLAMLRLRQGREYEAEKHFKEALESNPENSFALLNYVRFLIRHAKKLEAHPYAELLVELEPRNREARQLLAQTREADSRTTSQTGAAQ